MNAQAEGSTACEAPDQSRVRNDLFNARKGFELGRSRLVFALWYLVKCIFFLSSLPWPSALKSGLLRAFGAKVGRGVYWKPRVNVHIPWKFSVGEHTWIGEEVCIINFAPVTIGAHCCLSQRCFVCSGNHDYRAPDMRYRHTPITLADGVWIEAAASIGPGVEIGTDAVVTAGYVVTRAAWRADGFTPGGPARRSGDGGITEDDRGRALLRSPILSW